MQIAESAFVIGLKKFRQAYPHCTIEVRKRSCDVHDRALIVDHEEFYSPGTSLKDAGCKFWILQNLQDPNAISDLRTNIESTWELAIPV